MEWNYHHFHLFTQIFSPVRISTKLSSQIPSASPSVRTKVYTISVTYAVGLIILITGITFVVAEMRGTFSHVPLSLAQVLVLYDDECYRRRYIEFQKQSSLLGSGAFAFLTGRLARKFSGKNVPVRSSFC